MDPVSLFDLASLQARWLSARQVAVASNIANVNTPDYKARDVALFSEVLEARMAARSASSPAGASEPLASRVPIVEERGAGGVTYERELLKSSEIRSSYELNAAIVRAFHRMTLQVARP